MAIASLVAAGVMVPQSQAQPRYNFAGDWLIETDAATDRACVITGEARLTSEDGDYEGQLTFERCGDGGVWRSRQLCFGEQAGRSLRISCILLEATPPNYAADNFTLEAASNSLMRGSLDSTWSAPARWRRKGRQ